MQLISKNGWNLLKANQAGVVLISFCKGDRLLAVHATTVSKGWNIVDPMGVNWKSADRHEIAFFRAGMPPENISHGLGGSPIIPLSDQDELKDGENDLGSEMEPDTRIFKEGDPFLFSEALKEMLRTEDAKAEHASTPFSTVHGRTSYTTKEHAQDEFSTVHGPTSYTTKEHASTASSQTSGKK